MAYPKIKIPKKKLRFFYLKERLSPYEICRIYNCSFSTITNRLKEYGIPLKSKSEAQSKYLKYDFSGDLKEKAYLLGFRIGDLNCYRRKNSQIIVVRCHTTDSDQVMLIKNLFQKYGHSTVSISKYGSHINTFLNYSFDFLLPKPNKVPKWLNKNSNYVFSFISGYFDAEASFGVNQGRGRIKVDSYDGYVLTWIHKFLLKQGIRSKLLLIAKKDQPRGNGYKYNKNLWRVNINEAKSLLKFTNIILKYLKHKKMKKRATLVKNNILQRIKNGTIHE